MRERSNGRSLLRELTPSPSLSQSLFIPFCPLPSEPGRPPVAVPTLFDLTRSTIPFPPTKPGLIPQPYFRFWKVKLSSALVFFARRVALFSSLAPTFACFPPYPLFLEQKKGSLIKGFLVAKFRRHF